MLFLVLVFQSVAVPSALYQTYLSRCPHGSLAQEPVSQAVPNRAEMVASEGPDPVDVNRFNSREPAPMGISDYGIGPSGPYEYATKSFVGIVTIDSLLTNGSTFGSTSGFQLNVELAFNTSAGLRVYWIQNCPGVTTFGNSLRIVDFTEDIWNFSEPNANMSASGVTGNGWITPGHPAFYGFVATHVGFSPITLTTPTTITLNVTSGVSSSGEPTVSVGFNIGYGLITYDTVTFTNVTGLTSSPGFEVNGFNYTPAGYFYDAALILAGAGNGAITTDLQSDVQLQLEYWNGHNYQIVPNAYNFGSNTGESIDNVLCGFSNDSENGKIFAEILPGAGQLGELYDQSQIGIFNITSPLTSGTLYVANASDPNAKAWQIPFVSGEVTVTLYPGSYDLQLYGQTGKLFDEGNFTVSAGQTLSLQSPFNRPSVSFSPSSVVLDVGQSQMFTSNVSGGTPPYSYQWYLNSLPVSGVASATWTFTPSSGGSYTIYVNVTDNVGLQATSNTATVTVNSRDTHGVAVTNVTLSKTLFGQGYGGSVTVAVQNQGYYTETFNVTVYGERAPFANTTSIASRNVTLSSGNSTNITFTWNTTGFACGDYAISAYATLVQGETNTGDNNFKMSGVVTITIPGDINNGFKVGLPDLVLLAQAYGSKPGDSNWNPNADIDGDGMVGLSDLVILAQHYGQQATAVMSPPYTFPVLITNAQPEPVPSSFQQMITINSSAYPAYEASNLQNVEFLYANGTVIPSWLESGNSNTSTRSVYWLKIEGGIPADSSIRIYLVFASPSTNLFNNETTGEAPTLSPIYGEYDDGSNVFNFYDNFAGPSLSSQWNSSLGKGSYVVNNGVTINYAGTGYVASTSLFGPGTLFDASITSIGDVNNVGYFNLQEPLVEQPGGPGYAGTFIRLAGGNTYPDQWNTISGEANSIGAKYGSLANAEGITGIYTVGVLSSTSSIQYLNYAAGSSQQPLTTNYPDYPASVGFAAPNNSISVQWARVRALPPNGVMPSFSILAH